MVGRRKVRNSRICIELIYRFRAEFESRVREEASTVNHAWVLGL